MSISLSKCQLFPSLRLSLVNMQEGHKIAKAGAVRGQRTLDVSILDCVRNPIYLTRKEMY